MIGVVAAWNWLASSQLMECKHATRTVAYPPHLSSNYSRIAYAGAGNWGVLLADFSIIITLLGVCIAFQITFATLLREVPGKQQDTILWDSSESYYKLIDYLHVFQETLYRHQPSL